MIQKLTFGFRILLMFAMGSTRTFAYWRFWMTVEPPIATSCCSRTQCQPTARTTSVCMWISTDDRVLLRHDHV